MPKRPDFYCFFYCAAWDGPRNSGAQQYETASGAPPEAVPIGGSRPLECRDGFGAERSSGSAGLDSKSQRQIPVGRPGIIGHRACRTSPAGSIRRGR